MAPSSIGAQGPHQFTQIGARASPTALDITIRVSYALLPSAASDSVAYLLSSLPLSERFRVRVRFVIKATHPKAVVSLVDLTAIESLEEEEKLAGELFSVPSSTLGVI
jgi:hypothetical protein